MISSSVKGGYAVMTVTREIDGVQYARADLVKSELHDLHKRLEAQTALVQHLRERLRAVAETLNAIAAIDVEIKTGD